MTPTHNVLSYAIKPEADPASNLNTEHRMPYRCEERADDYATGMGTASRHENEAPWLMRPEDSARLLKVSRATIYSMIRTNELPSVTIRSSRRIRRDQLMAWLDNQSG
jgi:excisionase family DNA binding protein